MAFFNGFRGFRGLRGLRGLVVSVVTLGCASAGLADAWVGTGDGALWATPVGAPVRDEVIDSRDAERTQLLAAVEQRHDELDSQALAITATDEQIQAEQRAAEERARAEREAFIAKHGYLPETTAPREIARQIMRAKYGWGEDQFRCYDQVIMKESGWDPSADNPTSSAFGIPQALPGSKMASAGADWATNPATQITWGLGYVRERYGTPCSAWAFWQSHHWY